MYQQCPRCESRPPLAMTVTVVNDIVGVTFRAAWWTVGTLTANQNLSDVSVHRTWHSLCHSVSLNCWRHCRETYVDDSFIFVLLWVDNDVCVLCTKLLYNHEKSGLDFSHCYFYIFVCLYQPPVLLFFFFQKWVTRITVAGSPDSDLCCPWFCFLFFSFQQYKWSVFHWHLSMGVCC